MAATEPAAGFLCQLGDHCVVHLGLLSLAASTSLGLLCCSFRSNRYLEGALKFQSIKLEKNNYETEELLMTVCLLLSCF